MSGWWWLMAPVMIAFWALVIWGVVTLVRGSERTGGERRAEDILAERFASGELDEAEYRRRRDIVRR